MISTVAKTVATTTLTRAAAFAAHPLAAPSASAGGITKWITDNAVPLALLLVGTGIIFGARTKDWASVGLKVGIAMIGLAVVASATKASAIGDWALGLFWS